jgi:glycogen debranching enzyme
MKELLSIQSARKCIEDRQQHDALSAVTVRSSNGQFTEWFNRSIFDLNLMSSDLPTGLYPYAGVPWFNTPFGRDGIVTALECLWMRPDLARGVLAYLAETQATEFIAEEDAEPGKILHETRNGEMAALKEMPFGRYYGSVDATPLFVLLAGAYYERTGDLAFMRHLWPSVQSALNWMRLYGDVDGDGFIEYKRQSPNGLIHQGWKDSDDAIFHADGGPAEGAVALCEVQSYYYGALRAGAILAEHLGHFDDSAALTERAEGLHRRFNDVFWCDELSIYGLALDGNKELCRVRSSNAGQCLFSGIATADRARYVADTLLSEDCYSGWGIRTIASTAARYNPMSYHNGSIWPHDNGLIAFGMARYGLTEHVSRIFDDIFASATYFDRYRLPELFCGFHREEGVAPVHYPVACTPQSWSAASIFLLIQAFLGLTVDGISNQITLIHPMLPQSLKDLEIANLSLGGASLGFEVSGRGRDVLVRPTVELRGCSILRY